MSLRYALSAMFCLALLLVASVPVTANANSIEEASIDLDLLVNFRASVHLCGFACFHLAALVSALMSTTLVTTAFARSQFNQH
jgi:hypothetical protein